MKPTKDEKETRHDDKDVLTTKKENFSRYFSVLIRKFPPITSKKTYSLPFRNNLPPVNFLLKMRKHFTVLNKNEEIFVL